MKSLNLRLPRRRSEECEKAIEDCAYDLFFLLVTVLLSKTEKQREKKASLISSFINSCTHDGFLKKKNRPQWNSLPRFRYTKRVFTHSTNVLCTASRGKHFPRRNSKAWKENENGCGKIELTATVAVVAMVAYVRGWEQVAEVESLVNLSKSMGLKSDETMMHGARELESFKP